MQKSGFWYAFTTSAGERIKNQREATKRWRAANKERYLSSCKSYSKKYAAENKEKRREISRRYYLKHRNKEIERKKTWQKANKEKVALYTRRYYATQKLVKLSPKCLNCESILKIDEITVCNWCTKTYSVVS